MSNEISVVIGNNKISGWKDVTISRSLDSITGIFSLTAVNNVGSISDIFETQLECKIFIGDDQILYGTIFKKVDEETSDKTSLTISGRDITAALVDCSAIYSKNSWKDVSISRIVKDVCKPFGITVVSSASDILKSFTIQSGESAAETIQRACRIKGYISYTNGKGELVIDKITRSTYSKSTNKLIYGKNIKTLRRTEDIENRYSEIYVKGQDSEKGSAWTKEKLQQISTAKDSNISLYRPLVVVVDSKISKKDLQTRANWEIQYRAGKSINYLLGVKGFRQNNTSESSDKLWEIGLITTVDIPKWNINRERLCSNITYTFNDNGSNVEMEMSDPKTYKSNPTTSVNIS